MSSYGQGESGRVRIGVLLIVFFLGLALGGGIANRLGKLGQRSSAPETAQVSGEQPESVSGLQESAWPTQPVGDATESDLVGSPPSGHATIENSSELSPYQARRTAVVEAAERVGPAVVSISVTQIRLVRRNPFAMSPDPFDRFFSRFFPGPGQLYGQEIASLGSGVIIDERGIVVTNAHVVHDAKEIKVSLPDGRTFDASIIGSDASYDLAVLSIEGEDMPVASVGDSDALIVGEWAIALGNPFGFLLNDYRPTVTAGVISATHRDLKPDSEGQAVYKNMIQTDASINPGNSGGPLVNGLGEVIGINTFIFTTGGGSLGIGFARPINTVIQVVREILEHGRVRQVWIGIRVQEISQMVANYYRIRDRRGLLVWGIEEGSPAARAGLQLGDIIREVNGEIVSAAAEAQQLIFGATIGDLLRLTLERDGHRWEVEIVLEEAKEN